MDEWVKFIAHSLAKRLDTGRFGRFAELLNKKHYLPPRRIADILLRPNKHNSETLDPQIPHYVQTLLYGDLLEIPAVLAALLKYSSFRPVEERKLGDEKRKETLRWSRSYTQAEGVTYSLTKLVSSGVRPRDTQEAVDLIKVLTEWMKVLTVTGPAEDMVHEAHTTDAMGVRIAFGTLLVAAAENERILGILGTSCPKEKLKAFSQSLATFTPLLIHSSAMERLEQFRTQVLLPLEPIDKKTQAAEAEIDQMIDSSLALGSGTIPVVDLPTVNTRAGLYVYLNALFVGRPLIDDETFFNYLYNRYQGDIQSTCNDLILVSFEVVANAIFSGEGTQTTTLLRSFLINKLPVVLATLSISMFPPLSAEICITEALSHVDPNIFPNLSILFDETSTGDLVAETIRQDFCYACCLHGLIPEQSIQHLLAEIPMGSLPAGGRYDKDDLAEQCRWDPERVESLVEELIHMDGNVGAVSQAIAEIILRYCHQPDTDVLKILCDDLARQPSFLDMMLLFNKPAAILGPICHLLNNWRYHDDQGEYQPVYEEFGSILLLVLAFVNRYNLSAFDLGLNDHTSFIRTLLVTGANSRSMDELSELEKNHLDGWIRGLFNSAEGGGLGDEPMANCPPQDFYLLVPTLFHQIVLACSTGHLSDEALKGGLEYLVDTFLLPSLVGAITWLANHLWESHGDSNTVIQILQILINPASASSDTNSTLSNILNITAKPLEHSLRWLQRNEPTRQDVEPLLKILKPHLKYSRTAASDHAELDIFTTAHSGIANNVRIAIQSLTQWSMKTDLIVSAPAYTHRQILTALRVLGAKRLLAAIIEEVKQQTVNGNGAMAIDIAAAIICAPDADSAPRVPSTDPSHLITLLDAPMVSAPPIPQILQRRLTLLDALRAEVGNAVETHKIDVLQAETVIRLSRRAHVLLALDAIPPAGMLVGHVGLGGLHGVADAAGMEGVVDMGGVGTQEMHDAIGAATAVDGEMILDAFTAGVDIGIGGVRDDDMLKGLKMEF